MRSSIERRDASGHAMPGVIFIPANIRRVDATDHALARLLPNMQASILGAEKPGDTGRHRFHVIGLWRRLIR
jgi:hypothetical protein